MYLFFDGVSRQGYIGIFWEDRGLIVQKTFLIAGNESSKATPLIDNFLKENNIHYEEIQNIVVVVWPGSFTGIRTVSLIINTLAYIYPHISLTPISFFDLYKNYPIIKASSKRDLFVKWQKSATIEILSNGDFEEKHWGEQVYGDVENERFKKSLEIDSRIDYESIIQNIEFQDKKRVAPSYIKKPNIS